jgi:peptidoglycan/xylan/chitin deacetylase (PgdA/CDA1 family)
LTIVVHGPRRRQAFALTFDDGPERGVTDPLLEILSWRQARATFFCVGEQVERDVELARQILAAGHEVGCHTMHHLDHSEAHREQALRDLVEGAAAIEGLLEVEPRLYRAPYGRFVPATLAEAERRGWTCVLWSAWGRDWQPDDGETIAERVFAELAPGAIVLLHDAQRYAQSRTDCRATLEATELVLAEAERRGLRPVTVSELIRDGGEL